MFNLIEKRRYFFLISACLILPGVLAMVYSTVTTGSPFRLSIDFVGGSIYDLRFTEDGIVNEDSLRDVFARYDDSNLTIQRVVDSQGNERWSVRGQFLEQAVADALLND